VTGQTRSSQWGKEEITVRDLKSVTARGILYTEIGLRLAVKEEGYTTEQQLTVFILHLFMVYLMMQIINNDFNLSTNECKYNSHITHLKHFKTLSTCFELVRSSSGSFFLC